MKGPTEFMCELMAMSFMQPVSADFSLREFAARGEVNPDGWGLAWYPDGGRAVAVAKEPVKWTTSRTADFLADQPTLLSRIYLAHVREGTVGGPPNYADTHPFTREQGGRDYVLGHNGTLSGPAWDLPLGRHRPVGGTDSERFFCHLLHDLESQGFADPLSNQVSWSWLHQKLSAVNAMGKLNILLSDGARLCVYHDLNGWKGLNFRHLQIREGHPRHFGDEDLLVDLGLGPDSHPNAGFVVATYPMSPHGWHSFHRGELIVFDRGEIVFSSHRAIESANVSVANLIPG